MPDPSPTLHPAQQKAKLRRLIGTHGVYTTVQLERLGLLRAAEWLGLRQVTHTRRTSIVQPSSERDLTFVLGEQVNAQLPGRELMHKAGVAEAYLRLEFRDDLHHRSTPPKLTPRERQAMPDAFGCLTELNPVDDYAKHYLLELDAGYTRARIRRKLRGFDQLPLLKPRDGWLIWATTVNLRVETLVPLVAAEYKRKPFERIDCITFLFVDFWSSGDPYVRGRRFTKLMRYDLDCRGLAPSSGSGR